MGTFEIMIDGVAQPGEFATRQEANASALTLRHSNEGRAVGVREKLEPAPEAVIAPSPDAVVEPAADTQAEPTITAPVVPAQPETQPALVPARTATVPPTVTKGR